MDPVAPSLADGGDFNRYAYARNNPYRYTDSTGQYVETAWDVVNVAIGVRSFGANVAEGNWGAAALDAVGVLVDGLAVAAPFPGGVGTAIHMARAADSVVDGSKSGKLAQDIVSGSQKIDDLKPIHSAEALGHRPDISRLSDADLMTSVTSPKNGDFVTVNTRTGGVVDGNTRVEELQRRAADPNSSISGSTEIPIRPYTPDNRDLPDLR
jgi:hypothetical protein